MEEREKIDNFQEEETESFEPDFVEYNELDAESEEIATTEKLKSMRAKLKVYNDEKMKALEDLQRAKADFLNSKKRLDEQLIRDRDRIAANFVESLLPLADSFDMAMSDPSWNDCSDKWRQGIEGIYAQLQSTLKEHGVSTITETGVGFNPHEHDAVSSTKVADDKDVDKVITVLQKGYKSGNKVIRPARVIVGTT